MVTPPVLPPPLPRPAVDAHTHLDMLDVPVDEALAAARTAGTSLAVPAPLFTKLDTSVIDEEIARLS